MDDLIQELKVTLASNFSFYLKAHNYHWNIEGPNFPQYHSFFESIYTNTWEAVDTIAEHLRTLDSYAPASLIRFTELSLIYDEVNIPSGLGMISKLLADNMILIKQLTKTQELAEQNKKMGLSNFLQDRIDMHEKFGWQLRSAQKV